jgi:uncharacterized protein (TIGR02678 family)
MAFVDVLRLLESYGVIEVVDGSSESFVESATAKVLYQIDSTLLLRLIAAPVGPSQLVVPPDEVPLRFDELLDLVTRERRYGRTMDDGADTAPASEVQRNLWLRHAIFRRLADDPVLYLADLTDEERAYLASPTGRQLLRRAADQGGFVLEDRAEGVLFIDTEGLATDTRFPDDASTAKVAALLLLDRMGGAAVATEQLRISASALLARFPRWAKRYREDDGPAQLVCDALAVLTGFGLVRVAGGLVQPLPAAMRYAVGTARTSDSATEEMVLQ